MKRWIAALALLGLGCLEYSNGAFAQTKEPSARKPLAEGEIGINLNVNYRLAYREGTWVPVDVFVENNANDINGYVEVRTYSGDQLQSPVYRVSAQCPKSSHKRFRFHCFLNQTSRVETMVYNKNRPVQTVWPWLNVAPIQSEDLLGLVLNENPSDFGFLNSTVQAGKEDPRRFYREELDNTRLNMLADYEQCYTPYDVIILGAVEAERIQDRHRALLERYAREGGTVVICAGDNAQNYRHTWVEEWAGVSIGATRGMSEEELARAVFSGADLAGVKPVRKDLQVTELKPVADDVTVWSSGGAGGVTLAARRPMGRGQVVVLAVDAASKALQDNAGFNRLWRGLCSYRRDRGDLNFQSANAMYSERLPYVCGIQLYSKSSVMLYLFSYFAIAIVANWIVFSWLKRRELAWLVLVICAIGFTGYAMVFGTAGRAKASRLDQLEVLRVPRSEGAPVNDDGASLATVRSTVSLVTARTTRQSFKLSRDYSLAEDVNVLNTNLAYVRGPSYANRQGRFFYLQEDVPSRIDQFVVGASEMRLLQVLADVPVKGGFDGTLECGAKQLQGTLVNTTGIEIERPFIYIDNQVYSARVEGNTIRVDGAPPHSLIVGDDPRWAMDYGYTRGDPSVRTSRTAMQAQRRNLYNQYLYTLFQSKEDLFLSSQGRPMPNSPQGAQAFSHGINVPPVLVAWAKTGPIGTVESDSSIAERDGATIVVADIDIHRTGAVRRIWYDAAVTVSGDSQSGGGQAPQRFSGQFVNQKMYEFKGAQGPEVEIVIPPEKMKLNPGNLVISVSYNSAFPVAFRPKDKGPEWSTMHLPASKRDGNSGYYGTQQRLYDLSDWQSYTDPVTGKLSGSLYLEQNFRGTPPINVEVAARILADEPATATEDWKPWQ